jgi:transposase
MSASHVLQYPRLGWQVSTGISGSFQSESVASFNWNRWQVSTGISGKFRSEYAVVAGHHINAVSAAFHVANSALRKWVQRFAQEGPQGLRDRPRSGRPPKLTCELEQHLRRLVEQAPLEHGALSSQWSCRELATVFARETGVPLGRESVRGVLKKPSATTVPPAN